MAIDVRSDDPDLEAELALTLGTRRDASRFELSVGLEPDPRDPDGAVATFRADDDAALSADDLLLALGGEDFPFRRVSSGAPEWTSFAWEDDPEPLFSFRGRVCRIRRRPLWRRALALLILHRVFRVRSDAIFFHAAAVGIGGRGVLIVGPKGRGKSTTSLALACRGHDLLGDETACWVPARNELVPVLRPVGVKPGPRARALLDGLDMRGTDGPIVRVEIDRILPARPAPAPVPLFAILFLQPFAPRPLLEAVEPSTADIARLQPVSSSLVNAPGSRRVFELGRMLAGARVFRLAPGDPDDTAELLERTLGGLAP